MFKNMAAFQLEVVAMSVLISLLQGEVFLACLPLLGGGSFSPSQQISWDSVDHRSGNAAVNSYDSTAADVLYLNSFSDATILINSIQGLFTLLPKCFPIWHLCSGMLNSETIENDKLRWLYHQHRWIELVNNMKICAKVTVYFKSSVNTRKINVFRDRHLVYF